MTDTAFNISVTRRRNALALFQEFVGSAIGEGASPKGLEQSFAARVQISPSMWSQVKASRPIGDKLARQIEHHCDKPALWLDGEHGAPVASNAAEERFVELARRAWRAQKSNGRREMSRWLEQKLADPMR